MTRRHDSPATLDPAAVAELAALDNALSGTSTDREWAALVAAVREDAPAPRSRFVHDLDERVAAGFPRARAPRWRLPARRALPVIAVAATLLGGAVLVGTNALEGPGGGPVALDATTTAGGARGAAATTGDAASSAAGGRGAEAGSGAASSSAAPAPPVAADAVPAPSSSAEATPAPSLPAPVVGRGRKVEHSTTLGLTTDARGLQDAADGIVRATQDLGGVVVSSQVDTSPAGGSATFVLRIPADRLTAALKRFGALADVARLSQGAEDITASFVSAQVRLADARAERKALLVALGKAPGPIAIASLRARLRGNRAELGRLEGALRGLRRRTDQARVDVSLTARGAAAAPKAGSAWGPHDAARDALRVLGVVAGVALVAGAVLVPLALLGGGAALAGGGLRRRRREAALAAR